MKILEFFIKVNIFWKFLLIRVVDIYKVKDLERRKLGLMKDLKVRID